VVQKPSSSDDTRIDLGDDLLEKPSENSTGDSAPTSLASLSLAEISDQLQSAKILMSEGLAEEAKKILRRILLSDPGNAQARKSLGDIHELELKQIFGPERRRSPERRQKEESFASIDSEMLMRQLDTDLRLGLFSENGGEAEGQLSGPSNQLSLFQDEKELNRFAENLEKTLGGATYRDRIDLGIGFLEMSLYELAARQFRAAIRKILHETSSESIALVSATSLLAYSLILGGRPFEATLALQPVLRDPEIKAEKKVELLYLMGRAYDSLQKHGLALEWYQRVREIDPYFRDIQDRLRK
jgi:tetratricopeptide (TPR) repeat protein